MTAEHELAALMRRCPDDFRDGAACGLGVFNGEREQGGYPIGFHKWPLDRRNAWFAGFNQGYGKQLRAAEEASDG